MHTRTGSWIGQPTEHTDVGAADMVRAVFRDALTAARRCVVWTKHQEASWCASPEAAAEAATRLDAHGDVYFTACLHNAQAEKPWSRGSIATAVAMCSVWVDLDIAGPGHVGVHYPPSVEAALEVLEGRIPQRPSIVLATGGGLHLWWLLEQPMLFTSDSDRQAAKALVQGWQESIRSVLAERSWKLDETSDLARVMRIPGTSNHKHSPPIPVRVATWDVD